MNEKNEKYFEVNESQYKQRGVTPHFSNEHDKLW